MDVGMAGDASDAVLTGFVVEDNECISMEVDIAGIVPASEPEPAPMQSTSSFINHPVHTQKPTAGPASEDAHEQGVDGMGMEDEVVPGSSLPPSSLASSVRTIVVDDTTSPLRNQATYPAEEDLDAVIIESVAVTDVTEEDAGASPLTSDLSDLTESDEEHILQPSVAVAGQYL